MKLLKFIAMLAVVLLAWTGVLLVLAFTAPAGQPLAIVTLPGRGLEVAAASGGSYESLGGPIIVTRSSEAGFVRRLYGAGALLVIDARVILACHSFLVKAGAGA
jgi:hypothetical protein